MIRHSPGRWRLDEDGFIESDHGIVAEAWDCPERQANRALLVCAPELYSLLDQINGAFYSRTSRKEWLALMEKTKPLLRKAEGKTCEVPIRKGGE